MVFQGNEFAYANFIKKKNWLSVSEMHQMNSNKRFIAKSAFISDVDK